MAPSAEDNRTLTELITSTLTLLQTFTKSLTAETTDPTPPISNPPNSLHVLRDAATLLKAHTTKLSLLAINKPFTPSAITKVLRDLSGTCLPALLSAAQLCQAEEKKLWGALMAAEARLRVARVFREVENLLAEVQSLANGKNAPARRDSLSSTGVVWEACDALVQLEKLGVAGLAVRKAEELRDAIKDAVEELREWREGTDLETEGQEDALLDDEDEGVDGDADSIEDIFNAANSMPKDRPELRELVELAEGKLKKVVLLYTALSKRRLKTFKVTYGSERMAILDKVMEHLKVVQSSVDDLAGFFYELDVELAREQLDSCIEGAKMACDAARLGWEGKEDEFTAWSRKWEEAVG